MRSLEDFLEEGSRVFRATSPDPLAITNFLKEASDKAEAARNERDKPGNRVDNAYDAIHLSCLACLRVAGHRTTAEQGHHRELLEAVCQRIGGGQGLLDRVEAVMDARNRKYDGSGRAERDAVFAVQVMNEFLLLAERWLKPGLTSLKSR